MSNLVLRYCEVYENPAMEATFWHVEGNEEELWGDSCDIDMRDYMEALRGATRCGKPATRHVDFGEDRVWMCDDHYWTYQSHTDGSDQKAQGPEAEF